MSKIISVLNQKGGVGKTTTVINLAASLSQKGKKVLILDIDPQGNASSGLGLSPYSYQESQMYHVLTRQSRLVKTIHKTSQDSLWIVPTSQDLVGAELELVNAEQREYRLKMALEDLEDSYDFIFIDCPPSLGFLSLNALVASDLFLVPMQCEYYALEGLSQLLTTASIIQKNFNSSLELCGVVCTMFDRRNRLTFEVVDNIEKHLGDKLFSTKIPRNIKLSEAPSHGKSIFQYHPDCPGAKAYQKLATEFETKIKDIPENKIFSTPSKNSISAWS